MVKMNVSGITVRYLVCINLDKTFTAYRQKFTVCRLLTNLQQIPLLLKFTAKHLSNLHLQQDTLAT